MRSFAAASVSLLFVHLLLVVSPRENVAFQVLLPLDSSSTLRRCQSYYSITHSPTASAASTTSTETDTDHDPAGPPHPSGKQEPPQPSWIEDHLRSWDLRVAHFDDTGRGLQTTRARNTGDVLVGVPAPWAITAVSVRQSYPELFVDSDASLALTEEQVLVLGLLALRRDQDSYVVESLPTHPCMLWSHCTVARRLTDCLPIAYQRMIQAHRVMVERLHKSLVEFCRQQNTDTVQLVDDRTDFEWAFATVRSRTVGVSVQDVAAAVANNEHTEKENETSDEANEKEDNDNDDRIRVLLPTFDLLNHKFTATVTHDVCDGQFVVVSHDTYQAGDQVFISYVARQQRRNNLNMLTTYGFCPHDNPEEAIVLWDGNDVLEACARARPTYFPPAVQAQLQGLFHKLGQDSTLYEYDAQLGKPRETLDRAIQMMAEIERQFNDNDPTFPKDVLTALVDIRLEELAEGLVRLESVDCGEDSGWGALAQSVRALLSLERRYLSNEAA